MAAQQQQQVLINNNYGKIQRRHMKQWQLQWCAATDEQFDFFKVQQHRTCTQQEFSSSDYY